MNRKIYSEDMLLSLRKHIEKESSKYITYPKFFFLCGKAFSDKIQYNNSNRGIIENYIKKNCPDAFIVLSESLWEEGFGSNIDLLTFEDFLAEVSDAIFLFIESPGTFCELGAFAYADVLFSDKLIIVIDEKYRNSQSFIVTGPVMKAKKNGSSIVYAPVDDGALLSSGELRDITLSLVSRLAAKTSSENKRHINKTDSHVHISSFIVEILELIRITQPITKDDLIQIYKEVKGFENFSFSKRDGSNFHKEIKFGYILKLLENVKVIKIEESYITLAHYEMTQSLMFRYAGKAESKERNRILCRKYRYGERV